MHCDVHAAAPFIHRSLISENGTLSCWAISQRLTDLTPVKRLVFGNKSPSSDCSLLLLSLIRSTATTQRAPSVSSPVVLYLAMMAAALVARRSLMQLQRLFREETKYSWQPRMIMHYRELLQQNESTSFWQDGSFLNEMSESPCCCARLRCGRWASCRLRCCSRRTWLGPAASWLCLCCCWSRCLWWCRTVGRRGRWRLRRKRQQHQKLNDRKEKSVFVSIQCPPNIPTHAYKHQWYTFIYFKYCT